MRYRTDLRRRFQMVARFREATEARDFDALMTTLAPDAALTSPASGRLVLRGHQDLRIPPAAAYGSLGRVRWTEHIGEGTRRVLLAEAAVGPFRMTAAMILELPPTAASADSNHTCGHGSRCPCSR